MHCGPISGPESQPDELLRLGVRDVGRRQWTTAQAQRHPRQWRGGVCGRGAVRHLFPRLDAFCGLWRAGETEADQLSQADSCRVS
jgi:hypothetical protein